MSAFFPKLIVPAVACALMLCVPTPVRAATTPPTAQTQVQIKLTNGDIVSGVIVEEDKHTVVLRSPIFGELEIPRSKIAPLPSPSTPSVQVQNTPGIAAIPAKTGKPAQGVKPEDKPWRTKVEFGYNQEQGKNDITRYNVIAQSEKNIGPNNLKATGRISYSKQNQKETTDRTEAGFRWRHNFPSRLFSQTQSTYYRDHIAAIDVNLEQSVGLGYKLFDTDRFTFNFGSGMTGQYREANNLDYNTAALADFFQDQTFKFNEIAKLVQSFTMQYWPSSPLVAATARNEENLKWRFSTALVGKLSEQISINLRYEYDYDNTVANPAARETQRVISSLGYTF